MATLTPPQIDLEPQRQLGALAQDVDYAAPVSPSGDRPIGYTIHYPQGAAPQEGAAEVGQVEELQNVLRTPGHVPDPDQLLFIQDAVDGARPVDDGSEAYELSDGTRISADEYLWLEELADPSLWIQDGHDEVALNSAGDAISRALQLGENSAHDPAMVEIRGQLQGLRSQIQGILEQLPMRVNPNDPSVLHRLAELSRVSRQQLQAAGYDPDVLIRERNAVIEEPTSFDLAPQFQSPAGWVSSEPEPVIDRRTGRPSANLGTLNEGDLIVKWFIDRGLNRKDIMPVLESTAGGRSKRLRLFLAHTAVKYLGLESAPKLLRTVDPKSGLKQLGYDLGKEAERRMAILEGMELAAFTSGRALNLSEVLTLLYPERQGKQISTDDIDTALSAMARVEYAAEQHVVANQDHRAGVIVRIRNRTERTYNEFVARLGMRLGRAVRFVGAAASRTSNVGATPFGMANPGILYFANGRREEKARHGRLRKLERMGVKAYMTGKVPSAGQVAVRLYPDRRSRYTAAARQEINDAMAALEEDAMDSPSGATREAVARRWNQTKETVQDRLAVRRRRIERTPPRRPVSRRLA